MFTRRPKTRFLVMTIILVTSFTTSATSALARDAEFDPLIFSRLMERVFLAPVVAGPDQSTLSQDPDSITFELLGDFTLASFAAHSECSSATDDELWDCGIAFRVADDGQHFRVWIDSSGNWSFNLDSSRAITSGNVEIGDSFAFDLFAIGNRGYFGIDGQFVSMLDLSELPQPGRIALGTGFRAAAVSSEGTTSFSNTTIRSLESITDESALISGAAATFKAIQQSVQDRPADVGPLAGTMRHDPVQATFALAGVDLADLYERVDCLAPENAAVWDCGLILRAGVGTEQIRVIATSDGYWAVSSGPDSLLASGKVNLNQSNQISLDAAVLGSRGFAAIDGSFLTEFAIDDAQQSGDAGVGTAFYASTFLEGRQTRYQNLEIWSIDAQDLEAQGPDTAVEPIASPSAAFDAAGLNGNSYSTSDGEVTLSWPANWEVNAILEQSDRQRIELNSGPMQAVLTSYQSSQSPSTCMALRLAELDGEPGTTSIQSTPIRTESPDVSAAIATYELRNGQGDRTFVADIWCMQTEEGGSLALIQTCPLISYMSYVPEMLIPQVDIVLGQQESGNTSSDLSNGSLVAQEAESIATAQLVPIGDADIGGYVVLERFRRQIQIRAVASGVQSGDTLVIQPGVCEEPAESNDEPLQAGVFDADGLLSERVDLRLTVLLRQDPYQVLVFDEADTDLATPMACGQIVGGYQ